MKRNRFKVALGVQKGASNPIALTNELSKAVAECREEGADVATDPAVRLIAHQLADVLRVQDFFYDVTQWQACMEACREETEVCPKGGEHEWGTDGQHSNVFCKKCFESQ